MSFEPDPEPERIEPTHAFLNLTYLAAALVSLGLVAGGFALFSSYSTEQ